MIPDNNTLQPAWLLHRRPFRNTSLIVELFVPALGRVGAVVRGGRKDPLLAPFTPLWSAWPCRESPFTAGFT